MEMYNTNNKDSAAKSHKYSAPRITTFLILGTFAAVFEPLLLAVALSPLVFFIYYCSLAVLLSLPFLLYRVATVYPLRSKEEEVRTQSNVFEEPMKKFEELMWKSKHIPATNLVVTFMSARSKGAKIAALIGLWQLYSSTPPSQAIKNGFENSLALYTEAISNCWNLSKRFGNKTEVPKVEENPENTEPELQSDNTEWQHDIIELFGDDEKLRTSLEKNRRIWVIAAAALAFVTTVLPAAFIWHTSDKRAFTTSVVELGRTISAKNIIWKEVNDAKDSFLYWLWKACGQTYIPLEDIAAHELQKKCLDLTKTLREYEIRMNTDFFGAMRSDKIAVIEAALARIDEMYKDLSTSQKNQYNLQPLVAQVKAACDSIVTKRMELITNATGKQEPVVLHITGEAGHGKSELARSIVAQLEAQYGITAYYRNVHDDYWSNFTGQQILVWDDIGFQKDGQDFAEFCYHTAGAPSSAIGAAIKDKGRPANPLFIILTSNMTYLGGQGHNLATPTAFHRRRDIVINLRNTAAEDYLAKHGSTMPSNLYDPTKTKYTLMRSIPTGRDAEPDVIGLTSKQLVYEAMVEMEKLRSNRFKMVLRNKPYYKGAVPPDSPVDAFKLTSDFLLGKDRPVEQIEQLPVIDTEDRLSQETEALAELVLATVSADVVDAPTNPVVEPAQEDVPPSQPAVDETPKSVPSTSALSADAPVFNPTVPVEAHAEEDASDDDTDSEDEGSYVPTIDELIEEMEWPSYMSYKEYREEFIGNDWDKRHMRKKNESAAAWRIRVRKQLEEEEVSEQAVNPEVITSRRKTPVFVLSGPSGTGKTHTARTFAQRYSGADLVEADVSSVENPISFLAEHKDRVVFIDDITLAPGDYLQAVKIANAQYEYGLCKALLFTENSHKLRLMDSQAVAEMHRRAHIATFGYRWSWSQFFLSWDNLALIHKGELAGSTNKPAVVRKNITLSFREYESTDEVSHKSSDAAAVLAAAAVKTYGDDITTTVAWTLPMPSEIDFTVSLSRSFSDCGHMSASEVLGSIFTGSLYTINNVSGRFGKVMALQMVRDIFAQAPSLTMPEGTTGLEHMVIAFNDAKVQSTFRPPGVAVITTPDGAVGLSWKGEHIRMFAITSDHVELSGQGIDLHKYYDPAVETIYKELTSSLHFTEESIANTEATIAEVQRTAFNSTNVVCSIVNCLVIAASLAVQIYAPFALLSEMSTDLKDREQLRYLQQVHKGNHRFWKDRTINMTEPVIQIPGGRQTTLSDFEEALVSARYEPEYSEAVRIVIANPAVSRFFNHNILNRYPLTRSLFMTYKAIPSSPAVFDEGEVNVSQPPRRKVETYSSPTGTAKRHHDGVQQEAFATFAAYQDWVKENRRRGAYEDVWENDDPRSLANKDWVSEDHYSHNIGYNKHLRYQERVQQDKWMREEEIRQRQEDELDDYDAGADGRYELDPHQESAPNKKADQRRNKNPLVKESAPNKKADPRKPKRPVTESAPKPKTVKKKPSPVLEAGCEWYTSETHTVPEASLVEVRPGDQRYVYMCKDGWVTCTGPDEDIAARMRLHCKDKGYAWALFIIRMGCAMHRIDNEFPAEPELESNIPDGTILRVRRSLGVNRYWHYGIIGPHPSNPTDQALYHVQSRDVNGVLSAYVAVDPLDAVDLSDWEVYTPNTLVRKPDGQLGVIKKLDSFEHLPLHAYEPFIYHADASNCETWALAMAYGDAAPFDSRQQMPAYFIPLVEIVGTFTGLRSKFAEFRQLEDAVQQESCIDGTALVVSRKTLPPNQVFLLDPITRKCVVRGIAVAGQSILSVNHAPDQVIVQRFSKGVMSQHNAIKVHADAQMDLAIYRVTDKTMPGFKDITRQFMTVNDLRNNFYAGNDVAALLNIAIDNGDNASQVTYTCRVKGQIHENYDGHDLAQAGTKHGLEYTSTLFGVIGDQAVTANGDCGSPLIGLAPRTPRKIIGIHRAGSTKNMYASIVPQEWLLRALKDSEPVVKESFVPLDGIIPQSAIDDNTGFPLVGISQYSHVPARGTKLRLSPIAVESVTSDCEPAILHSRDPRCPGYDPALTTISKFKRQGLDIDTSELFEAGKEIAQYIVDKLGRKKLRVFTTTEAINGPARTEYPLAGQIDRSTSAGFPQTQRDGVTSKAPYFARVLQGGEEIWKIARTDLGNRLRDDLSRMLTVAKEGKRPNVVFSYFPKDEVLKRSKIDTPNTRGILSGNLPYVIAYRRYFQSAHLRVQEIFDTLPIKIGINPMSIDWANLASYHLQVGSLGFDADAKAWDASLPVEGLRVCRDIVNTIYKKCDPNWTPEDDIVRSSLHACVESPYIMYNGRVIQTPGGQVSGQPGTAFDNSLFNWALVLVAFKRAAIQSGHPEMASIDAFHRHCALSVYGDDMIITLSQEALQFFNLDIYIEQAARYGIEITPADKVAGKAVPLKRLEDMTFLKRGFKQIGRAHVGPIELKSIAKAIKWIRGPGSYTPTIVQGEVCWKVSTDYALVRDNLEHQLAEAALHGPELFTALKSEVNYQLVALGMEPLTVTYFGCLVTAGVFQLGN